MSPVEDAVFRYVCPETVSDVAEAVVKVLCPVAKRVDV